MIGSVILTEKYFTTYSAFELIGLTPLIMTRINEDLKNLTKRMRIFAQNFEELTEAVYNKAEEENRIRSGEERRVVITCKVDRNSRNWAELLGCNGDFYIGKGKSLIFLLYL